MATSYCSIEHLCCGDDHVHAEAAAHHDGDNSHEAEAAEHADGHDAGQSSGDSHHHSGAEGSCCSTLKATAQNAQPFVSAKPALLPLNLLCAFIQAHDSVLAAPKDKLVCQANPRDWGFTPVVCLECGAPFPRSSFSCGRLSPTAHACAVDSDFSVSPCPCQARNNVIAKIQFQ